MKRAKPKKTVGAAVMVFSGQKLLGIFFDPWDAYHFSETRGLPYRVKIAYFGKWTRAFLAGGVRRWSPEGFDMSPLSRIEERGTCLDSPQLKHWFAEAYAHTVQPPPLRSPLDLDTTNRKA